jgi:hypothetical protein
MRKMGMRQVLLGALAAAALLSGCAKGPNQWAMTAQEDYYPDEAQTQNPASKAYSNLGSSTTLYQTNEQGTGGAGNQVAQDEAWKGLPDSKQNQADLWMKQDSRVPYPPPQLDAVVAMEYGTGKPLLKGPNGAWVQGTYAVEVGSGKATSIAPSSGSYQPREPAQGKQSLPNELKQESDNTGGMSPQQ